MLVTPFNQTDAFKLGIIDADGTLLIKPSNFETVEQKEAYTYLDRLVFNLKRMLSKLPGGDSKLKNIVAAFYLIKEAYENVTQIDENKLVKLVESDVVLIEEHLIVKDFLLSEDAPTNSAGAAVATDAPKIKPRRFSGINVPDSIFRRFSPGKMRLKECANRLDMNLVVDQTVYKFIDENCDNSVIVLRSGQDRKGMKVKR